MLNVGNLIDINPRFFLNFLGWQSMLALFLAAFVGPGQISPDLANNALPLYLARPFSRAEYVLGKLSVLLILMSLMTWVPGLLLFILQAALEGNGWFGQNLRSRQRHLLRRLDLDFASVSAGAGAFRLGEMEAGGGRPDVRCFLRGCRIRRRDQRHHAHPVGQSAEHQPSGGFGLDIAI